MAVDLKFFVTAGRGTEVFVSQEIEEKIINVFSQKQTSKIQIFDGKVHFRVKAENPSLVYERLLTLKTVERVFVTIQDYDNLAFISNKRTFLDKLMAELSCKENFHDALTIMNSGSVSALCSCSILIPLKPPSDFDQCGNGKNKHQTTRKRKVHDRGASFVDLEDESFSKEKRLKSDTKGCDVTGTNKVSFGEKNCSCADIRKSVAQSETVVKQTIDSEKNFEILKQFDPQSDSVKAICEPNKESLCEQHRDGLDTLCNEEESKVDLMVLKQEKEIESRSQLHLTEQNSKELRICLRDGSKCATECQKCISECHNIPTECQNHPREIHKCLRECPICNPQRTPLKFRMSVKCSGKVRKWLEIKRLSRDLAWRVSRATGWRTDLTSPDFEVCVQIRDDRVTIGVPLTRFPLSKRDYIVDPGLRTPIAWIMARLADIQPHHKVLDPMCGKGTLLIESSSFERNSDYYGIDRSASQLNSAKENIAQSGFIDRIQLFLANSLTLPIRDAMFDRVLCDAPFNQKHMIHDDPESFYLSLLTQIHRVLLPKGKSVLLTSEKFRKMIQVYLRIKPTASTQTQESSELHPLTICEDHSKSTDTSAVSGLSEKSSSPLLAVEKFVESHQSFDFWLSMSHYVKLGETDACIMVMDKI